MPNPNVQWWQTSLPVNEKNRVQDAEYRLVAYDLMLQTSKFLEILPEFEDHGMLLIQSYDRMPDTLVLDWIPENQQSTILKKNGAFLRIYLPHAVETAQVQCFESGYLAEKISSE